MTERHLTLTHWGAYEVETDGSEVAAVHPFAKDPDPSPIGRSLEAVRRSRVMAPSVRQSWLEDGPGSATERRGVDPFVEVEWDVAADLATAEIERVRSEFGNEAIFGGSYGWASAGRFHHAQSQLHRFLTTIGGYTSKRETYSHAAGEVIVPHVLGKSFAEIQYEHTSWPVIAEHTDLIVAFGGIPLKNAQVQSGGHGRHTLRGWLEQARDRGTRFVNLSPVRDDLLDTLHAEWLPLRPGSDVAVMLGLIHTLVAEGLADEDFLSRHAVGWDRVRAYVLGTEDGVAKTAEWAGGLAELDPERIRVLALELAEARSLINISWAVQRTEHGEQTFWAVIALAAALGQIGLPGGGFGLGYGAVGTIGNGVKRLALPSLPRSANPVSSFIPVARIADMLLHPGEEFDYDGRRLTYPDIELIYWAGGNPFHHHQDLNRLVRAWRKPGTVIVNEPFWTATARRADIVFPVTTPLERDDIGGSPADDFLFAMSAAVEPVGAARNDYEVFAALAERLGVGDAFTEGRTGAEWLRHLYGLFTESHPELPDFGTFREAGFVQHAESEPGEGHRVLLEQFRTDPDAHPLPTPSGRIELYSKTIAEFEYEDCPGHPTWFEPSEWLGRPGRYPLHLVSNQPTTRLHSQLDHGVTSREQKVGGREVVRMHPSDASDRGVSAGDAVRVFNDRGACLASVAVSDDLRPGVVELPTGAWFDPEDPATPGSMCRHGNPNVLTRDVGTSSLAQGPTAHTCMVEIALEPDPPPVGAFEPPALVRRD